MKCLDLLVLSLPFDWQEQISVDAVDAEEPGAVEPSALELDAMDPNTGGPDGMESDAGGPDAMEPYAGPEV
jgi:hypothetical protein